MVYPILLWLSVTLLIQICSCLSEEVSSPYECGKHGRFEYCIDGIPGCVIGCHCHPGYYFDTETKICEPNIKLSEDFKRLYMSDPNRMYPINTPTLTQYMPTQTTTNALNEKVEEISKDTDDIGEWLYNQFFKTIETQVINNATDDKPLITRRSNDEPTPDNKIDGNSVTKGHGGRRNMGGEKEEKNIKKKRKTRKFMKDKGKKDKKVHGLRRKLLRITEDDSLFDSESRSDSGDTSSSSSSSDSSDSSDRKTKKTEDRDHGHKKVIIFNRRPRPPLPSFIFLPNMDSPYYPPIGLAPPPVLPMYPMVPVPPMAPFLPIIAEESTTSASTNKDVTTAVATTTTAATTKLTTIHEETTRTESTTSTEVPSSEPNALRNAMRGQAKKYRGRPPLREPNFSEESFMVRSRDNEPRLPLTDKQIERIKLVNSLKHKLKMKKKLQNIPSNDIFDPTENIDEYGDIPTVPESKRRHHKQKEIDHNSKDVNFKYLSQLIHKLNGTESPSLAFPSKKEKIEKLPETRRAYSLEMPFIHYDAEGTTPSSPVIKDPNDEYFMNLGRQIAALIRDEDAKLDNMAIETTEANSMQESIHSILNENRYAPRSYWERFVRSPLSRLKSYLADLHFYKPNHETSLFSLEDEVNTFASTTKPLTLLDLENMLTNEQKNNTNTNSSYKYYKQPDVSFNVNLMPKKNIKVDNVYRRMYEKPDLKQYVPDTIQASYKTEDKQGTLSNNASSYIHPTNVDWMVARGSELLPMMTFTPKSTHLSQGNVTRNILSGNQNSNHSSKFTQNNIPTNLKIISNMSRKSQGEYLKFLKRNPVVIYPNANKPVMTKYPELPPKYLMVPDKSKPTMLNYKSLKYFSDNRNNRHYMFEAAYPVNIPSFKDSYYKRTNDKKSSYFHHEFHHFDYLE